MVVVRFNADGGLDDRFGFEGAMGALDAGSGTLDASAKTLNCE